MFIIMGIRNHCLINKILYMHFSYKSALITLLAVFLLPVLSFAQADFSGTYTQNFSGFSFGDGASVTSFGVSSEWSFDGSNLIYRGRWGSGNSGGFRGNDDVMGYQHSSSTGTLTATLTLTNTSAEPITSLDVSYQGRVERVNEGRSPEWTVSVDGTQIPALTYSTQSGTNETVSTTINDLNIQTGATFTISWQSDRGEPSGASKQIGLSEVFIETFEVQTEPTISILANNEAVSSGDTISFPFTDVQATSSKEIEIRNKGNEDLEISGITISGSGSDNFSTGRPQRTTLGLNETTTLEVTFSPSSEGEFGAQLEITSNAANVDPYILNLVGETFPTPEVISIAEAREVPFGTRVTVSGRVTVGNQLGGPAYFQDETAGIAAFWEPFHTEASIGDSIVITGPVTEFNPIGGTPGDFLRQISDTDTDDNISFEILSENPKIVQPEPVTLQQMNSGNFEGQLVIIQDASINFSGNFQANTNYVIEDATTQGEMRIDNNTNLVDVPAPGGSVNIVGVVGQFNGVFQLLPRFADDMGADPVQIPGNDTPLDETFDVVTWNIEWFGNGSNGPSDEEVQFQNVKTLISTVNADLYAFQEISNSTQFDRLVSEMTEYGGFEADFSQQQKTAFMFKRATIDSLSSGLIRQGMDSFDWANGRLPLMFQFSANIKGTEREIFAFNIHAKAVADQDSYNRRVDASAQMKTHLDLNHTDDNAIFLGDYNDDVTESIFENRISPYQNFVDDPNYTVITKTLSEQGATSFSDRSMIDHITINSVLRPNYFEGTEQVINPFFIGNFLSETSDHFPVTTRFLFSEATSKEDNLITELPNKVTLNKNYPNPFNPTTQIEFSLPNAERVTLDVFNIMGRKVATLINNATRNAGLNSVTFDASSLSSGVYFYRLSLTSGRQITRKMMLIK